MSLHAQSKTLLPWRLHILDRRSVMKINKKNRLVFQNQNPPILHTNMIVMQCHLEMPYSRSIKFTFISQEKVNIVVSLKSRQPGAPSRGATLYYAFAYALM